MKVLLILAFGLVIAASALTYGQAGMAGVTSMAAATPAPSEPATLLFSGGLLLAAASALRRYTI